MANESVFRSANESIVIEKLSVAEHGKSLGEKTVKFLRDNDITEVKRNGQEMAFDVGIWTISLKPHIGKEQGRTDFSFYYKKDWEVIADELGLHENELLRIKYSTQAEGMTSPENMDPIKFLSLCFQFVTVYSEDHPVIIFAGEHIRAELYKRYFPDNPNVMVVTYNPLNFADKDNPPHRDELGKLE